ncbi:MAG: CsgG/HfaB family protein [Candidatus Sericytochromatia bacterium]
MQFIIKKAIFIALSLSLVSNLSINTISPVYAESKKVSLAIIDFDNNSGITEWEYMEKGIPRILIANLAKNKGLKVLEREKLESALKELKFSQTGYVDPETARKLGKITGADYALYGSITRFGNGSRTTIVVDASIVEIQTGEIKYVESVRGNDENAIINLIDKLSVMILNDLIPNDEIVTSTNYKNKNDSIKSSVSDFNIAFTAFEKKNRQIYLSNDNGVVYKITDSKEDNFSPKWSPDKTKLAFVNSKYGISVYSLKTGLISKFSEKVVKDDSPIWSPDSKKVVFMTKEGSNYAIYSGNSDGSGIKPITPEKVDVDSFDVSKNGQIVYSGSKGKKYQLFITDLEGSSFDQITRDGNNLSPSWSPDGNNIAFISDRDGYERVHLTDLSGSEAIPLTKGKFDEDKPVWSSDGRKIAFTTIIKKKGKVSVVNSDGSSQKILINDDSDNYDLTWIPNSNEIAFTYNGNIYTINSDGGAKSMLSIPAEDKEEPVWK